MGLVLPCIGSPAPGLTHHCYVAAVVCHSPGSAHRVVLLCAVSFAPVWSSAGVWLFLPLGSAGRSQWKGERKMFLKPRCGKRCGVSGRHCKGLLPVPTVLIFPKVQCFLREELVLADCENNRGVGMWDFEASSTAWFTESSALSSILPCQSQGCFSCSTVRWQQWISTT